MDEGSYAAQHHAEELQPAREILAGIEAMDAEETDKPAEQEQRQFLLATHTSLIHTSLPLVMYMLSQEMLKQRQLLAS
jgi:hypothetical protein